MNSHFYVQHSGMLADGLRNLGTRQGDYTPSHLDRTEGIAGAVLGEGLFNISRKEKNFGFVYQGAEHKNPFVRRCSALALGLAFLGEGNDSALELLRGLSQDEDVDVKRTALISTGLVTLGKSNPGVVDIVGANLENPHWKIRSAAGLGYSFAFLGKDDHFERVLSLLKNDDSPYVKVCSCWYVSLSYAKKKETEKFLDLIENGDSFFRDMATLGIGFSHLGSSDTEVRKYLGELATKDSHPYVRESSFFGLGLNDFRNPNNRLTSLVSAGLADSSPITRSGASLSLGLVHFRRGNLNLEEMLVEESDPSVLWGASLSSGLSGNGSPIPNGNNNYVAWANELRKAFLWMGDEFGETSFEDINIFQRNVNEGLIKSAVEENKKDALRLLYPGISYYTIYESFWWGLWMLSSLGATLWDDKNGNKT